MGVDVSDGVEAESGTEEVMLNQPEPFSINVLSLLGLRVMVVLARVWANTPVVGTAKIATAIKAESGALLNFGA